MLEPIINCYVGNGHQTNIPWIVSKNRSVQHSTNHKPHHKIGDFAIFCYFFVVPSFVNHGRILSCEPIPMKAWRTGLLMWPYRLYRGGDNQSRISLSYGNKQSWTSKQSYCLGSLMLYLKKLKMSCFTKYMTTSHRKVHSSPWLYKSMRGAPQS